MEIEKDSELILLTEMKVKGKGIIKEINGGISVQKKLESLGLRIGKKITKVSSQIFKGPVVLEIDGNQLALGYGLAEKIKIQLL